MTNYLQYIESLRDLARSAARLPLGMDFMSARADSKENAFGKIVIFAPHPDDECIIGLLPLRAMLECGAEVVDIAVTLGSNKARRMERLAELEAACSYLNWRVSLCAEDGFENVNIAWRNSNPIAWQAMVEKVGQKILQETPRMIILPHLDDWNITHVGVGHLVLDALALLGDSYDGYLVEYEYWGNLKSANLMLEANPEHIAILMEALSRHTKELERNDYHVRLPFYMADNVRRGAELIGGQGGDAPKFDFASLYNVKKKNRKGEWVSAFDRGVFLSASENIKEIF